MLAEPPLGKGRGQGTIHQRLRAGRALSRLVQGMDHSIRCGHRARPVRELVEDLPIGQVGDHAVPEEPHEDGFALGLVVLLENVKVPMVIADQLAGGGPVLRSRTEVLRRQGVHDQFKLRRARPGGQ